MVGGYSEIVFTSRLCVGIVGRERDFAVLSKSRLMYLADNQIEVYSSALFIAVFSFFVIAYGKREFFRSLF